MSPVRTSIPKGAHALVEVNGRRDVVCVPLSPTLVRKDTDGCLDAKSRNCDWHRESDKNETWRLRSDIASLCVTNASLEHGSSSLIHCATQMPPNASLRNSP